MILGIDVSTYPEVRRAGGQFFQEGKPVDPLAAFRQNGVTHSRIRVWVDPYDANGTPYLGGTCDENNFFALAEQMKEYGYTFMPDFHYSDFWADPSKQFPPKAWAGLDNERLGEKVYEYTRAFLLKCRRAGVEAPYIQIGNEITNGMLWPNGKLSDNADGTRGNFQTLAYFLSCGARACREVMPEAKVIVHVERSHLVDMHREYFDALRDNGLDYDVIGLSYYPYWHGTFDMLESSLDFLNERYRKEIMIVETGYGFTSAPFLEGNSLAVGEEFLHGIQWEMPYDLSVEGQRAFVARILDIAERHGVSGVFYWEPCWIPAKGICWASEAGERYTGEEGKPTLNEWANQCLFDYDGNMLPAFCEFSTKKKR